MIDTNSDPSIDRTKHGTNVIAQLLPPGKGPIDPPPDSAHAVGAPLRPPSGRPPLRAHRVGSSGANPLTTQSTAGSMTELPYHPHIQHANLGVTSIYLQGIDRSEIIHTVHSRPAPMIPATAGLGRVL